MNARAVLDIRETDGSREGWQVHRVASGKLTGDGAVEKVSVIYGSYREAAEAVATGQVVWDD